MKIIAYLLRNKIIKNVLLMLFFGILSQLFAKINFVIPGVEGTLSNFSEIPTLISVIYLPHWIYTIGVAFIASILVFVDSSSITGNVLMHIAGIIAAWYFNRWIQAYFKNVFYIGLSWIIFVIIYYAVILIPIYSVTYYFENRIEYSEILNFYLTVMDSIRFEVTSTAIVIALFMMLLFKSRLLEDKIDWLNLVIDNGNMGLWDHDLTGRKSDQNEQWYKLLGYSQNGKQDEIPSWMTLLHPDDKEEAIDRRQSYIDGKIPFYDSQYRMLTKDGKWIWIQDVGKIVEYDQKGKPKRLTGILLDITEKKLNEDLIKSTQEKLAVSLGSIPEAIIILDNNKFIEYVNSSAEKLLSLTKEDLIGKRLDKAYQLFNPDTKEEVVSLTEKVLSSQKVAKTEKFSVFINATKKKYLIQELVSPVMDKNNQMMGLVLVAIDVTEKHRLDEQLRHSNKMDAIGHLAGGIAHDFNNMLGGISSAAYLINATQKNLDEKGAKYIAVIQNAANRAADLTSKLLTFSRKNKKASTVIKVNNIVDEGVQLLKRTIDKKIQLVIKRDANNDSIIGDDTSIQNALINLCINSSHAMADGGEIVIETRNMYINQKDCDNSSFDLSPGEFIEISVNDSGSGITTENIKKIFDPFFTTKAVNKGTGLGLSVVYGTVIDHDGSITVYSEINHGTIFKILLPCTHEEITHTNIEKNTISGKGQILLVDDEEIIRVTCKDILEEMGYQVITAENGQIAVEIFKEKYNEIDLVLMDMIMPQMNGMEAFFAMKKLDENCKIIISSGFSKSENLHELKKAGMMGFVNKPFHAYELSKTISKALGQ